MVIAMVEDYILPNQSDCYTEKKTIILSRILFVYCLPDAAEGRASHFDVVDGLKLRRYDSKISGRGEMGREIIVSENNHTYPELLVGYE